MLVDLNHHLKDLEGKVISDANMGRMVANALAANTEGDPLKFWDWAQKLYRGDKLDLDPSDREKLINFVKEHRQLSVLAKAQILTEINTEVKIKVVKEEDIIAAEKAV